MLALYRCGCHTDALDVYTHGRRLRVTAARESGHHTHGDGTAVDLIPVDGTTQPVWNASAGRLAQDLGWRPGCARSGSRPACPLARPRSSSSVTTAPQATARHALHRPLPRPPTSLLASACYGSKRLLPAVRLGQRLPSTGGGGHRGGPHPIAAGIVGADPRRPSTTTRLAVARERADACDRIKLHDRRSRCPMVPNLGVAASTPSLR
jgi:hypothetical protein